MLGASALMILTTVPATTASASTSEPQATARADTCTPPVLVKQLGAKWTVIGASYADKIKKVTRAFSYGKGQPSSLEVGISLSGNAGSFTADGTKIIDSAKPETFLLSGDGNDLYLTRFEFAEYKTTCTSPSAAVVGARSRPVTEYLLAPSASLGGARIKKLTSAPRATHCVSEEQGSTFTLDRTAAPTFNAAFSVRGFSGSAQTGYSKKASVAFDFHRTGQLCGTNGRPTGDAPGFLVAR
jgi:hypothetical protein